MPTTTRRSPLAGWLAALLTGLLAALLLSACGSTPSTTAAGQASAAQAGRSSSQGVGSGLAPGSTDPSSGLRVVSLGALPAQAADTLALIRAGGPFPYRQDGAVYHNANRVLPRKADGYYHEYTVKTPGAKTRGARRIIHGSGNEYYWTANHYDSFQRIA